MCPKWSVHKIKLIRKIFLKYFEILKIFLKQPLWKSLSKGLLECEDTFILLTGKYVSYKLICFKIFAVSEEITV